MNVPIKSTDIQINSLKALRTGDDNFDQLFPEGLPLGSATLLAGTPGAGKSTLISSLANKIADQGNVLYVSGEESATQVKTRFNRLGINHPNLYIHEQSLLKDVMIYSLRLKVRLLIIDSIQTLKKDSEEKLTLSKATENVLKLIDFCQEHQIPVVFIGHTTKEGKIAGALGLQHFVDTILLLTKQSTLLRTLKASKNRFGQADQEFVYTMTQEGLIPVYTKEQSEAKTLPIWLVDRWIEAIDIFQAKIRVG